MSFTNKCNKCGNEREFTSESKKYDEKISIDVYVTGSYSGINVEEIEIGCTTLKCQNSIEIKY